MEFVTEFRSDPTTHQQREELYCAAGDLEVLRAEGIEAEGADDDGGELLRVRT